MHLRLLKGVHIIAATVICSLVYFAWIFPSLQVTSRITKHWNGTTRRLVVFGDSLSDTASYAASPPSDELKPTRHAEEGRKWTEVFYNEYLFDSINNFARSYPSPASGGAVLNNEVYANSTSSKNVSALNLLPDLAAQVQQWISYEEERVTANDGPEEMVFAISFGQWDVDQYATLRIQEAEYAISCSIYTLFQQLDIIADQSPNPRIVIPRLWDITMNPRFLSLPRIRDMGDYVEPQHKVIWLVRYWNTAIDYMAAHWSRGDIFVVDWDSWVEQQIRSLQMYQMYGISDSKENQKEKPLFRDVSTPCMDTFTSLESGTIETVCKDPLDRLFWDTTQFGSVGHRALGREAARLVNANKTTNGPIRREHATTNGNDGNARNQFVRVHLVPSLPPGI